MCSQRLFKSLKLLNGFQEKRHCDFAQTSDSMFSVFCLTNIPLPKNAGLLLLISSVTNKNFKEDTTNKRLPETTRLLSKRMADHFPNQPRYLGCNLRFNFNIYEPSEDSINEWFPAYHPKNKISLRAKDDLFSLKIIIVFHACEAQSSRSRSHN